MVLSFKLTFSKEKQKQQNITKNNKKKQLQLKITISHDNSLDQCFERWSSLNILVIGVEFVLKGNAYHL